MAAYVRLMIERAPGRAVLQFNRIDFSLAWFRRTFPDAAIVHFYRHPRDQWCSTFPDPTDTRHTASPRDFADHDHYYLHALGRRSSAVVSVSGRARNLTSLPDFYYIWKLSYWFGVSYAHYSLSFEQLAGESGHGARAAVSRRRAHRHRHVACAALVRRRPPGGCATRTTAGFARTRIAASGCCRSFSEERPGLEPIATPVPRRHRDPWLSTSGHGPVALDRVV